MKRRPQQVVKETHSPAGDERTVSQQIEITGVLFIGLAFLSLVAIFWDGAGFINEIIKQAFFFLFGERGSIIPIVFLGIIGWTMLCWIPERHLKKQFVALSMLFLWALIIMHIFSGVELTNENWSSASEGAGVIGHGMALGLVLWFGKMGTVVFLFIWLVVATILALNRPLVMLFTGLFSKPAKETLQNEKDQTEKPVWPYPYVATKKETVSVIKDLASLDQEPKQKPNLELNQAPNPKYSPKAPLPAKERQSGKILASLQSMLKEKEKAKEKPGPKKLNNHSSGNLYRGTPSGPYQLPGIDLVTIPGINNKKNIRMIDQSQQLVETLAHFGIRARVIEVHHGPVITRYELQPAPGVKVSRIVNLIDDIALSLAAKGLRLEAPIPGKAAIGVEVPNNETQIVTFREVLDSKVFWNSGKLSFGLGMDIAGEAVVADLQKMPHLLIAGATGSGKSVCVNTLIMSILYKSFPNEVKFIMIDPKMVELSMYNDIPHLMAPVVTEAKKASGVLKVVVNEMERRYKLFAEARVRDLAKYNALPEVEKLPFIVVIIDELADLMMIAPVEVEDSICRLAQMARATGIHLVVATQRPSVDVITGLIKANIPSRIAFAVSSQVDSRTILDSAGAERLLGRGDMLFAPVGSMKPLRVQGALVTEREIEAVIKHWKTQGQPKYQEQFINIPEAKERKMTEETDELFWDAVRVVVEHGQASASALQRRLRVGYTRAARLIDMMESKSMIGPYEGSKPREVYLTARQLEELRKKEEVE
ncbi:MAG: DNA translocase FtsK [Firmicutes bacterium]|nr:DNA translocase FtsK [Bacillota bacterium]